MLTQVEIKGFDDFANFTKNIVPNGPPVLFYFSGSKLPNGNSWCPDCVEENKSQMCDICHFKNIFLKEMPKQKVIVHTLNNYEEFTKFVDNVKTKRNIYFLFSGSKKENGRSWCIYCQLVEPLIKSYLTEVKKNIIFVYVDVGDRDYWKDRACPFRTDSRTKLMVIPTIIKWQGVQRLEGSQCGQRDLLQMVFEEDD